MNYLGINRDEIFKVTEELNTLLSSYSVYYQNLRSFHWNVEGRNFFELHEIFEQLYNSAKENIDEIAERVLTLRLRPLGSLSSYIERTEVEESDNIMSDEEMVTKLLEDHKVLIASMRRTIDTADKVGDEGTIDLIAGMLAEIEKRSWMLDAWKSKKFNEAMAQ